MTRRLLFRSSWEAFSGRAERRRKDRIVRRAVLEELTRITLQEAACTMRRRLLLKTPDPDPDYERGFCDAVRWMTNILDPEEKK